MTSTPNTYDEWLALSDEDRHKVHFKIWDVYKRDGIAIAFTAATRLALSTNYKVIDIQIGTYHGGEYLLHMVVSKDDFSKCPPMLQDIFEGFRVAWLPAPEFQPNDNSGASLEGSWISDDGYYEFDFIKTDSGLIINGQVGGSNSEFRILHPTLNEEFIIFSAYDPNKQISTQHSFRLVAPDVAVDDLTQPQSFIRK